MTLHTTTSGDDWTIETASIPAKEMFVDYSYQREPDARMAKAASDIARAFNPDLFQPIEVSDRGDKATHRYAIIDGQTRWQAIHLMHWDDQRLPARVHRGLTVEEEGWLFQHFQTDRRPLSRFDLYRSRLRQGEKGALAIQRALLRHSLVVGIGDVGCLMPFDRIYARLGRKGLERVVDTICLSWGPFAQNFSSDFVLGLGAFLTCFKVSDTRLVDVLSKVEMNDVLFDAKSNRSHLGGTLFLNVAEVLRQMYNKNLHETNRLERLSFGQMAKEFRVSAMAPAEKEVAS